MMMQQILMDTTDTETRLIIFFYDRLFMLFVLLSLFVAIDFSSPKKYSILAIISASLEYN